MATTTRSTRVKLRGGPPVLAGTPRRVRGHLELENAGRADVLITSLEVADGGLGLLDGARPGSIPVRLAVPAGRSARVPVRLRLDRTTPPGRHEIEISAGGMRTAAAVDVAEHPRARISPPSLALRGAPGATLKEAIVVANLGNVPIPLDRLGAVTLEESGGVCRSLESALREEGERGYQAFLDRAVKEIAETRVDRMRVRAGDATAVQPGETRTVELELRLPPDLRPGRRYAGLLTLVGASLLVEVTAEGGTEEGGEPTPAPRRRARRASPARRGS
jgi:hypothetical protein